MKQLCGHTSPTEADTHAPGLAAVWTIKEAAAFLRCPRTSLYHLVAEGQVPYRKLGRRFLFHADELLAWWSTLPGTSLPQAVNAVGIVHGTPPASRARQRRRTEADEIAAFHRRLDALARGVDH